MLCHAARLRQLRSIPEWVSAARKRSTFMSRALSLEEIASDLISLRLVGFRGSVATADALRGLSEKADSMTLQEIARQVLKANPPAWIRFAMADGFVNRDYIPASDLAVLSWLGEDLEQILIDVYNAAGGAGRDALLKAMGDAAELFIFEALKRVGRSPRHVAKLSDIYGYDIECPGPPFDRIEVKAASRLSSCKFHLTRNEFEKSITYRTEWRLIQVIFSGRAFLDETLNASHVESVRELRKQTLEKIIPGDTSTFRWTDSAEVFPPTDAWTPVEFHVDSQITVPGFSLIDSPKRIQ